MDFIAKIEKILLKLGRRQAVYQGCFSILIMLSYIHILAALSATVINFFAKKGLDITWFSFSLGVYFVVSFIAMLVDQYFTKKIQKTYKALRQACFRDEARNLKSGDISRMVAQLNGKKARNKREG